MYRHVRRYTLAVAAFAVFGGCTSASVVDDTEVSSEPAAPEASASTGDQTAEVFGTLIETLELEGDHRLSFYEFSDGLAGVRESAPIGTDLITEHLEGEDASLEAVFRLAAPHRKQVPTKLLQVDRLVRERNARAQENPELIQEPACDEASPPTVSDAMPVRGTNKAAGCTGDRLNDNFGAQWFLDNFCNEGNFRWCLTNRTSGYTGEKTAKWWKWVVMAADFEQGARMYGEYRPECCGIFCINTCLKTALFSIPISPRRVESVVFTGKFRYASWAWPAVNATCERMHYANMYNQ